MADPKYITVGNCCAEIKEIVETTKTFIVKAFGFRETYVIRKKKQRNGIRLWSRKPRNW